MSKPTYYELLRRPEWQRKRLEIMERDGFACVECGDDDKTLNVHHRYYKKNAMPWDYEDESLETLCEPCHERCHATLDAIRRNIGLIPGLSIGMVLGLTNALVVKNRSLLSETVLDESIDVGSYDEAAGVAAAYHLLTEGDVISAAVDGKVSHKTLMRLWGTQHQRLAIVERATC